MKIGKKKIFFLILSLVIILVGCSEDTNNSDDKKTKDTINVALSAQPATLDPTMASGPPTSHVARNIFEGLMAPDSKGKPQPMLTESVDTSEDGKTYTFHLRENVMFHNGEEMTSEDVVASLEYWEENLGMAKDFFEGSTWETDGEYTVVLQLDKPSSLVLDILAFEKTPAAVMPKEIIDSAGPEGVKEFIGTGPYKYEDWKQDSYIHLIKYEDYQPVKSESDGLAGEKNVLVDNIYFHIVKDTTTRLSGIEAGEYDVALEMDTNSYEQLKNSSNLKEVLNPYGDFSILINKQKGLFSDYKMREAVNAALDLKAIMMAGWSDEDLFGLDPSYMDIMNETWASEEGKEKYNQNDPEKAKQLLKEAGYEGQEIILITARERPSYYKSAVVIKEQLDNVGINTKLQSYDWATFLDYTAGSDNWDLGTIGLGFVETPLQLLSLSPDYRGNVEDEQVERMLTEIKHLESIDEAREKWDELQKYVWGELLPVVKVGTFKDVYVTGNNVSGLTNYRGPVFWNTEIFDE